MVQRRREHIGKYLATGDGIPLDRVGPTRDANGMMILCRS